MSGTCLRTTAFSFLAFLFSSQMIFDAADASPPVDRGEREGGGGDLVEVRVIQTLSQPPEACLHEQARACLLLVIDRLSDLGTADQAVQHRGSHSESERAVVLGGVSRQSAEAVFPIRRTPGERSQRNLRTLAFL